MEINAQDVISKLSKRIADLEAEKAVVEVHLEKLSEELEKQKNDALEGEVV